MRDDVCNNSEKEINKKMSRGLGRVCRSYLLVLLATSLFLDVRRLCTASAIQRNSVCDDGKVLLYKNYNKNYLQNIRSIILRGPLLPIYN